MIRRDGPHRFRVADLMRVAGLTHGGFYVHFKSRDAMVLEAMDQLFDASYGTFQRRSQGDCTKARLRAYIEFYLSLENCQNPQSGCSLPVAVADVQRLAASLRIFMIAIERLIAGIAERLASLGAPDPAQTATSLLAELVGAVNLARATPDPVKSAGVLDACRRSVLGRIGLPVKEPVL